MFKNAALIVLAQHKHIAANMIGTHLPQRECLRPDMRDFLITSKAMKSQLTMGQSLGS